MPKISVEFDGSVDMTDPENPKVTPTSIFRFENVITVDDEIQQLPGTPNHSSTGLFAVVNPAA